MINFTHSLILPNLFALFSVATANLRYEVIDRAIFTWFCQARGYKIPLSGSVIREKALQLAAITNPDTEFTASIGWFTSFTKRHNLSLNILCGEGSTATQETVELWKSRVIENVVDMSLAIYLIAMKQHCFISSYRKNHTQCMATQMLVQKVLN